MQNQYFRVLNPDVQRLVRDVEATINAEIEVKPRDLETTALIPDESPAVCDCFFDGRTFGATILYPAHMGEPTAHILSHEVMHAHRNFVLSVPRLEAANDDDQAAGRIAGRLENDVEHLTIIPIEIAWYAEAREYWGRHYHEMLLELTPIVRSRALSSVEQRALRENLLRHWMVTSSTVPNWSGQSALAQMLNERHLLPAANRLLALVPHARTDKPRFLAALLSLLDLDPSRYILSRFSVSNRRMELQRLPSHGSS